MRLDRFYSKNFEIIESEEFHHLFRVLRHRKGDRILVFDGNGNEYICEIIDILDDRAIIKKVEKVENREYKFNIAIAQALIKKERFEIFLEKVVEIGVNEIYPFISEYSVVRMEGKKERWERIILSACKQSHRQIIPKIHQVMKLGDVIRISKNYELKLFASLNSKRSILEFKNFNSVLVLVGPEGGFSEKEEKLLIENGFLDFNLGNFILRSETASIISVASLILNKLLVSFTSF